MVTIFLRGGLGNQMFQYALGLNLSKQHGVPLLLDTTFLNDRFPRRDFAHRKFCLDVFSIDVKLTPLSVISKAIPVPGLWLGLDILSMRARDALGMSRIVKEKEEHSFDSEMFLRGDKLILWGRWQNPNYFQEIAPEVRGAFQLKMGFTGAAQAMAEKIRSCNAVAIHLRRGDFASSPSALALHGTTDLSYYRRAVEYLAARAVNPHFFIFSDDPSWCRENFALAFPSEYLGEDTAGPEGAYHLSLMSLAKHNIIAPSTFSWWGAWLNGSPEKIVIAPKHWYADGLHDAAGLIPEGWVRL